MPNRDQILANVRSTLLGISPAGGYNLTIGPNSVIGEFRAYNEVDPAVMPALCVFPSKQSKQPPVYYPFGSQEAYLDIEIDGHVSTSDPVNKELLISQLEDDVRNALMVDPTRNHWAVDTIEVDAPFSDEGVPDKNGTNAGTASVVLVFRCTYYPNG